MKIRINEEVKHALENNIPVVCLESTIISHGMPYPKNVETALKVEQVIRDNGCVPATIGIVKGVPTVGLSKEEIEEFASRKDIVKVSRRDLPLVISKKQYGATTVATTMIIASLANIKFFVTGGIGGVHIHGEDTMDVSADLIELASTQVMVICAGVKAILDLKRTLEYLETFGVTVIGYKQDTLGAFYYPDSHLKIDGEVDDFAEAARVLIAKEDYKLRGGILLSNPIPKEYALDEEEMNSAISEALKEADEKHISGKEVTPFLLSKVASLTKGDSLESNIALVINNAIVGANIAKAYYEIKKSKED